jgi:hypothetical protein
MQGSSERSDVLGMPDYFTPTRINVAAGVFFALLLVASVALGRRSPAWAKTAKPTTPRTATATKAPAQPAASNPSGEAAASPRVFTPAMLPSSAAPARISTTGVVRLPASVAGVLVDGSPRRVAAGSLMLTCGWHRIKTPQQPARPVNVPCGGTAML